MTQNSVILFVDSDSNQLQSLQRSLRDQRHEWHMLFADDVQTAQSLMAQEAVDILVSETRLSGGMGSDLLKWAQQHHPHITRLLFSGQAIREPAQEIVQHTHQFIAKPCEKEALIAILQRIIQFRSLVDNLAMREMVNSLETLPSLPDTYVRLIELLRSEAATVHQIGEMVAQDLAMSTKVLQMVNSAFFGLPRHIASPAHAVSLLGMETVTNLALSAGIFNQLKSSLVESFDLNGLWHHSLMVAGLARNFYMEFGFSHEEADVPFLAGLLHDLGKLVLVMANTDEYRQVLDQAEQQNQPTHLAEEEHLWSAHPSIGAYLMGIWGLPFEAVEAVALHHKAELQLAEHQQCLVVYAANLLIHNLLNSQCRPHYATDDLETLLGSDRFARWMSLTREYLDGETT